MDRRVFLKNMAWTGLASPVWRYAKAANVVQKSWPNIVYILADDLGYGDLRCYNPDSKIPTPFISQLAAEGVRFTDAHSGSAVCTPTRYGILTGRYSWRGRLKKGVLWGYSYPLIEPDRLTVASLLKKRGYATACVGKWHLGLDWLTRDGRIPQDSAAEKGEDIDFSQPIKHSPNFYGFDYFFGIPASLDMVPYVYIENDRVTAQPDGWIEGNTGLRLFRAGPIAADFKPGQVLSRLRDQAVAFIEKQTAQKPDQPFFLYFPLTAPHTPVLPTDSAKGRSQAGDYGDFVVQVDDTVGAIVHVLQKLNLLQNTLIFFTSDNGSVMLPMNEFGHLPNDGLRGRKSDVWDGGHRIPFISHWPATGVKGKICQETICLTDLMATCAEIAKMSMPENAGEDSFSLLPLIQGKAVAEGWRAATIHHSSEGLFAIRRGRWKLIEGRGSGGWSSKGTAEDPAGQLYDMQSGLDEKRNLYLEKPELVREMMTLLETMRSCGRSR